MGKSIVVLAAVLFAASLSAQNLEQEAKQDSTVRMLVDAGFVNVRAAETADYVVYTLQNDRYKIPAEGFAYATKLLEEAGMPGNKPVKIIGLDYDIPQVTMTYRPETESWSTSKTLDSSWELVKKKEKHNSSFGKVDINIYPEVSLMNLIITQVYQSLWQLSPAVEVSLWPGGKLSYQVKIPVYNDGYGVNESRVHPGMIAVSQRFRIPWNTNIFGKATVGTFSNGRYGAALELAYYFPNERFWIDTQLGLLANYYFRGFVFHFSYKPYFRWNVAANYYSPFLKTQFTLRAQQFLLGDYGAKFEMIRHFRHCSIGFYLEKGTIAHTNGGFRFQIGLPPYRYKRSGYWPRVNTSGQMGMSYNANNELKYYKEYKTEASDNIMSKAYYNSFIIDNAIANWR